MRGPCSRHRSVGRCGCSQHPRRTHRAATGCSMATLPPPMLTRAASRAAARPSPGTHSQHMHPGPPVMVPIALASPASRRRPLQPTFRSRRPSPRSKSARSRWRIARTGRVSRAKRTPNARKDSPRSSIIRRALSARLGRAALRKFYVCDAVIASFSRAYQRCELLRSQTERVYFRGFDRPRRHRIDL